MALTDAPTDDASASPPPPVAASNQSKTAWIVAGVATAVALVSAMFVVSGVMRDKNTNANNVDASAGFATNANGGGFARPVRGTIQSIHGSSFTVKETRFDNSTGTTAVSTTKKTVFREQVAGALSDLKVGQTVALVGTTANGVFTATNIDQTSMQPGGFRARGRYNGYFRGGSGGPGFDSNGGPPQGADPQGAPPQGGFFGGPRRGVDGTQVEIGKITNIDGDTLTLSSLDGRTITAQATATTAVRVEKVIGMKDLKVGDAVRVIGALEGNKVTADQVTKGAGSGLAS